MQHTNPGSASGTQTETKQLVKSYPGEGKNIILAITGASGAIYGLRMLRALLMNEFNVDLIINEYAEFTLMNECNVNIKPSTISSLFPELIMSKSTVTLHNNLDLKSDIFLNNYVCSGMIISPCSMAVLSGVACGAATTLIEKSADNMLAHCKPLILVPRESPLNRVQLNNMVKVIDSGGKIVPAMPSFEYSPQNFNDLADFIAGKVTDLLCAGYNPVV
jgi:4-hydroxy-3-polyprenylbenzoate decarboxylase